MMAIDAVKRVRTVVDGRVEVDVKRYARVEKIPGGEMEDCMVSVWGGRGWVVVGVKFSGDGKTVFYIKSMLKEWMRSLHQALNNLRTSCTELSGRLLAVLSPARLGLGRRDVQQGRDPLQDEEKDREPPRAAAGLPARVQERRGTYEERERTAATRIVLVPVTAHSSNDHADVLLGR